MEGRRPGSGGRLTRGARFVASRPVRPHRSGFDGTGRGRFGGARNSGAGSRPPAHPRRPARPAVDPAALASVSDRAVVFPARQPPNRDSDASDIEPCLGCGDSRLEIPGQPPVAAQPCRRPLAFERLKFRAGISAIGENAAQPRRPAAYRNRQGRRAVAVLDAGGTDRRPDSQPTGIGDDIALAALDLLADVEAARNAAARRPPIAMT